MGSPVDESGAKVISAVIGPAEGFEEIRQKLELYFCAWRFPPNSIPEKVADTLVATRAALLTDSESDAEAIALKEADRLIRERFNEELSASYDSESQTVSPEERLALLCSDLPTDWDTNDPARIADTYTAGISKRDALMAPARELETYLTTMRTSLSRLPSFRMVAGWFLLILGLLLAFILTR